MEYTLGDKIAEVVFDKIEQYSEAQELAFKFDEFTKEVLKSKESTIAFLEKVGIYENGELSKNYK